ncbi:endonuclease SmrB [Candidatus Enterovibrio escicola]|uniref:endonuclease SmrB n=1 Tax=Candidatus Enterovibrio escicola TaxID=1927127 RepID=UPI0012382456|nr:endonuclease SmrB [Candidatus Enterovibrio escacola]
MNKKTPTTDDNFSVFHEAVKDVRKLQQDTINPPKRKTTAQSKKKLCDSSSSDQTFYFSDEFEPLLKKDVPTQYTRIDIPKYEVKRLRRGLYIPDIFLDLHGLSQIEAKCELSRLITECIKEKISCACVMHGIGKHILKQKTPLWLAQHPDVLAFHQAPLEFGGAGALLVLIEILDN